LLRKLPTVPSFVSPLLWIGGWLFASVWYRLQSGKPIIPHVPSDAIFHEKWCSGRSLRNWLTRIGGARNCLIVYVQGNNLVVTPTFPFTLMFLPEIYCLDVRVPLTRVASVKPTRTLFLRTLRIEFVEGGPPSMELRLYDEEGFIRHLGNDLQTLEGRKPFAPRNPRKLYGAAVFRIFMAVWGTFVLVGAFSGLHDDIRYRRDGIEISGVIDGHSGVTGQRNDMGILSYSVGDHRYHLRSYLGNGIYRIGDSKQLFYLQNNPVNSRESSLLSFDLIMLSLGFLAFTIAILGGKIARRLS